MSRMRGSTFLPNSSSARMSGSSSVDPGGCSDRSMTPAPTTSRQPDLLDHRVRAPDEGRRQGAAHDRRARFARDVAGIHGHHRVADTGPHREGRLPRKLAQRLVSFLVGVRQEHVRPIDDLLRGRLPPVARALLAVVARGSSHALERSVGDAAAEVVASGELAGLAARSERVGRRIGLLERARPDGNGAVAEVTALPSERLRLRPRLEDQLHPLVGPLP